MLSSIVDSPLCRRALRLLGAIALVSVCAFGSVTITVSGTYDAASVTNTYTAPNAHWMLSFQVDNQPSVFTTTANEFRTHYRNAVFTLNGATVPVTGDTVVFSKTYSFNVFLDSPVNTQFGVQGPQLFTGSTANPTITTGSFTPTGITSATTNPDSGFFWGTSTANSNIAVAAAASSVPTVSEWGMALLSMLLACAAAIELRRANRARGLA